LSYSCRQVARTQGVRATDYSCLGERHFTRMHTRIAASKRKHN